VVPPVEVVVVYQKSAEIGARQVKPQPFALA
jgi:hypothetical protein